MATEPWYQNGLRFTCTQCGKCCSGPEGYVWVSEEEIRAIAAALGTDEGTVRVEHTRRVGRRVSLKEFPNGDCTFLHPETRKCTLYGVRPAQCRTWPFWNSNIASPEAWEETKLVCPGTGHGQLYSLEEVEKQAGVIDI